MAKIPIVSVYDKDGNRIEVPAIVGRSAYQSAQKLGYTGSEEEWIESLRGKDGRGIKSIVRTEGDGTPGTTDTYTITYTDNESDTFTIHNGIDRVFVEEKIDQLSKEIADKADKAYIIGVFEELKALIESGNTAGAIAVLDAAILDMAILA